MKHLHSDDPAELTLRGMIIGGAITAVFMAANVYLGLKTGMTFSSSIPAAIISLSILRAMGSAGILENNIIQTQASGGGTLCNVILRQSGSLVFPGYAQSHVSTAIAGVVFACALAAFYRSAARPS